jgi:hypothetical protein
MGEKRNAYKLLVGKLDEKRPVGRPRRSWVNNIKMDIGDIGWRVLTGLVWLRLRFHRSREVVEWLHNLLPLK